MRKLKRKNLLLLYPHYLLFFFFTMNVKKVSFYLTVLCYLVFSSHRSHRLYLIFFIQNIKIASRIALSQQLIIVSAMFRDFVSYYITRSSENIFASQPAIIIYIFLSFPFNLKNLNYLKIAVPLRTFYITNR